MGFKICLYQKTKLNQDLPGLWASRELRERALFLCQPWLLNLIYWSDPMVGMTGHVTDIELLQISLLQIVLQIKLQFNGVFINLTNVV